MVKNNKTKNTKKELKEDCLREKERRRNCSDFFRQFFLENIEQPTPWICTAAGSVMKIG